MDKLNKNYIDSLPQPFIAYECGGGHYEVFDIDVETGLLRALSCGKLFVLHISEVLHFLDADGNEHNPDTFYLPD